MSLYSILTILTVRSPAGVLTAASLPTRLPRIALALARDEEVDTGVRVRAAEVLGRFADARVLPDLERIAQKDKARDVHRAARRAIKKIRRRA